MTNTINNSRELTSDTVNPKSPLEFSWTFWYLKPDKRTSWENSLVKLIDVGFVEDFWATFNHLALPSRLASQKNNSDYFFFKKGIRPMWEDAENARGGRWLLTCASTANKLDDLWQETLLGMIGDCFSLDSDAQPLSHFITGCIVSIRNRGHKIALWLSEGQSETIIREIGRRWKSMINLSPDTRIQFDLHNENTSGPAKAPMFEE
ncbi:unnamed protein product [Adineta steineri]|uniref:EIF-4F 25 kDa subunit n=1 Tax=Adineta steineri TaxID=433720 RepID=A0A819GXP9_9BILA|nr:unnamed protein product [Adineta steineri]CAF0921473.1 unnamed protein product [Adineta steineri]CAF0933672.1 unnamed protein product [Adineta steineri]CAF0997846.1 unnamed protein product [Adineta steineri]CAF1001819.1 unnamed protein product [Adineta steineri]